MKVTLKLYATLADYLPQGSRDNRVDIDVSEHQTVGAILDQYRLPAKLTHLVLINGLFVPPDARPARTLHAGDHLAVWPPIAGG